MFVVNVEEKERKCKRQDVGSPVLFLLCLLLSRGKMKASHDPKKGPLGKSVHGHLLFRDDATLIAHIFHQSARSCFTTLRDLCSVHPLFYIHVPLLLPLLLLPEEVLLLESCGMERLRASAMKAGKALRSLACDIAVTSTPNSSATVSSYKCRTSRSKRLGGSFLWDANANGMIASALSEGSLRRIFMGLYHPIV